MLVSHQRPDPFASVNVLLFDGGPANSSSIRAALVAMGFRNVVTPSFFDEVERCIRAKDYDVLIADITGQPERVCRFVRGIRQGENGSNPFMILILTSWAPRARSIDAVLASGADDVLIRPFSADFLAQRIKVMVEARKSFVVTGDYIGPSRKRALAPEDAATALDVPNTLRLKVQPASDRSAGEDAIRLVQEAQGRMIALRLAPILLQMRLIARVALKAADERKTLTKLVVLMLEAAGQLRNHGQNMPTCAVPAASAIARAVVALEAEENVGRTMSTIDGLARTLQGQLDPRRTSSDIDAELAQALAQLSTPDEATLSLAADALRPG
jgi:DNA-binding response OmpR family regulator